MKNKGFSLVELIVVIAIMAILVGVAVPVYTSYISSAQKSADIQLSDEVKHAIEIGLVGDKDKPADFGGGVVVVLSGTGARVEGDDAEDKAFIEGILADTFGGSWASDLKLKYDGWESGTASTVYVDFAGSSYDGKEDALLSQVQVLASKLTDFAKLNRDDVIGTGYGSWLQGMEDAGKLDASADETYGNAAVLYVAETMTNLNSNEENETFEQDFINAWRMSALASDGLTQMLSVMDGEYAAATASVIASYEAFFQYASATQPAALANWNTAVAGIALGENGIDINKVGETLTGVISYLETDSEGDPTSASLELLNAYFGDETNAGQVLPCERDAKAYLVAMKAITESEDALLTKASDKQCYTDGELLSKLQAYVAVGSVQLQGGELAVVVNGTTGGLFDIVVYPLEY